MTYSDQDPSPDSLDYDPYELFKEELNIDDALDLGDALEGNGLEEEPQTAEIIPPIEPPLDEDRLYTDEFIRQNESASRFLLLSVIGAIAISIGVGVWYLWAKSQSPPPVEPLPVPQQPSMTPFPNLGTPTVPNPPISPGQSLPPTDSGVLPTTPINPSVPTIPNAPSNLAPSSPTGVPPSGVPGTPPPPPPLDDLPPNP